MQKHLFTKIISLLLILICTIIGDIASASEHDKVDESQVKSAFIYNLAKYISFKSPQKSGESTLLIGIFGRSDNENSWLKLNNKVVSGKKIKVIISSDVEDIASCGIIFIPSTEKRFISRIISRVEREEALTVSDIENFINSYGGMVEIGFAGDKIAFKVNLKKARTAGVEISSYLLKLSKKVYQ